MGEWYGLIKNILILAFLVIDMSNSVHNSFCWMLMESSRILRWAAISLGRDGGGGWLSRPRLPCPGVQVAARGQCPAPPVTCPQQLSTGHQPAQANIKTQKVAHFYWTKRVARPGPGSLSSAKVLSSCEGIVQWSLSPYHRICKHVKR